MVEHLKVLISRAPKGDGGQSSLLPHPLMAALMVEPPKGSLSVEHLKVLMVEHLKVLISRAPKGPLQFTYLPLK